MQQVNLFQPAVRKKQKPFSALMTVGAVLLMSVALTAFYMLESDKQTAANEVLFKLDAQEAELLSRVEVMAKEYPPKQKSQQLEQRIDLLHAEHNQKLRVLEHLDKKNASKIFGFVSYLEGLAKQRIPELWLTSIQIKEGGEDLLLEGSALNAHYVPTYLQRLSAEKAYIGREFYTFHVDRPEQDTGPVNFSIGTIISAEGK